MKATGFTLMVVAALGIAFFLATDPRVAPKWALRVGWPDNAVDASHMAISGTVLGLGGSLILGAIGIWLLVRKAI